MDEKIETTEMELAREESPLPAPATGAISIWTDQKVYKTAIQQAQILAKSDLVPEQTYKGKPANCLIALDLAYRMNMSPLNVMQNLYIVKGKPGWSGQFCISAVNSCGRFSPLEFVQMVDEAGKITGYYAQATSLSTGKICTGSPVTWAMVKGEGWDAKPGSKWKTMPDQMFRYRCAAFFARTFAPEILNGLQTVEELKDVRGYDDEEQKKTTVITLDS